MRTKEITSVVITAIFFVVYIATFGHYGKKVLFILLFVMLMFAYNAVGYI